MRILIQLFFVAFLIAIQSFAVFGQSRSKVITGYASMSSVATTLWVAQDKGFFAKNNIDVQTVFIPGSPTLVASLNTGDVQFGYTGGTATLGAAVGGLDVKILAAFSNYVQNDLVVRPEIKVPADLKGKRIGVTSIGGTGWMAAMLALEQVGLNPERDKILLAAFGDQRVITQALETGTIQGAALAGVFPLHSPDPGRVLLPRIAVQPRQLPSAVARAGSAPPLSFLLRHELPLPHLDLDCPPP